jgi:hypothetical protein
VQIEIGWISVMASIPMENAAHARNQGHFA